MSEIDIDYPKEDTDPVWMNEDKSSLPEAPMSIHIDSYLNGFHVGWTKRMDEKILGSQVIGIKAFVKTLIDEGFLPSWNTETNGKAMVPVDPKECKHTNYKILEVKKEGINQGKNFKSCIDCKAFAGWV